MSSGSMGQGARGKGEDDKDHQTPDFLRGQHLDEWINDGEKVLPAFGAIGEEPAEPAREQPPAPRPASTPPSRGRLAGEYR
jgi:hypothetical protein